MEDTLKPPVNRLSLEEVLGGAPGATAVVFHDGSVVTYAELARRPSDPLLQTIIEVLETGGDELRAKLDAMLTFLPLREVPDTAVVDGELYGGLATLRAGGTVWMFDGLELQAQVEAIARIGRPAGLCVASEWAGTAPVAYLCSSRHLRRPSPSTRLIRHYEHVAAVRDDHPAFAFGSVGRAAAGWSIFAASPSGGRLPTDATGELMVRGPRREYRTGDVGHVDREGFVYVERWKEGA